MKQKVYMNIILPFSLQRVLDTHYFEAIGKEIYRKLWLNVQKSNTKLAKEYKKIVDDIHWVPPITCTYTSKNNWKCLYYKNDSKWIRNISKQNKKIDVYIHWIPSSEKNLSYFLNKAE